MSFCETAKGRYSCRGYKNTEVRHDDLEYILECARIAPSACNLQPWKIYVVRDEKLRGAVCGAYPRDWLKDAPMIAVFCGLRGENWMRAGGTDYLMCDIAIIADHFINAAHERGLGTCWIAAFDESRLASALNLPENEKPYIMTPLGYAAGTAHEIKKRKSIGDICCFI
ncbi:nitroreductase [Geovibrio thiophilus]|uniref:Nitroreductase n=1 Tax=Geovibrio thiophilus TaxID=139438 RepID=A0A3R5UX54_9BACT|nr:nitroreductase family protein [Geovibrio thiophilus]QAR31967.1 nitroreductase [Geovibrio thiophilus]